MNIQTKGGMAEGLPLSDIQENNKLLKELVHVAWAFFALICVIVSYLLYKVVVDNVVNNIVARCVG